MRIDAIEQRELDDGTVERTARVRSRVHDDSVSFIAPAGVLGPVEDASGLVSAFVLPAMVLGEDLEVDGVVAPGLLERLEDVRTIWKTWRPALGERAVRTSGVLPGPVVDPAADREVGCFFSRGVDSLYSATVDRSHGGDGDDPTSLVYLLGVDYHQSPETREVDARCAEVAATAVGLPLVVIRTNVRDLTDRVHGWGDCHGPVLAGTATLLGERFRRMVVPSTYGIAALVPFGSHPLVDHRFSTGDVRVEHDDVVFSRVGKVFALANQRPEVLAHLKVCWEEGRVDNCGRCTKCLHTMAALLSAGALDRAALFPRDIDVDRLAGVRLMGVQQLADFVATARSLRSEGEQGAVKAAMLTAVRRSVRPTGAERRRLVVDRIRGRRPTTLGSWHPPETTFPWGYADELLSLLTEGRSHQPVLDRPEHPRPGPPLRPPATPGCDDG